MNLLDIIHIEIARKYSETYFRSIHIMSRLKITEVLLEQNFKTEKAFSMLHNSILL
jgi:hypothetical protein